MIEECVGLRAFLPELHGAASDSDDVAALLFNELHQLHEGNIARYRIRPARFRAWLERQRGAH